MERTGSNADAVVAEVKGWLENLVIGLDLCPFAAKPYRAGQVDFQLCAASEAADILSALYTQVSVLLDKDAQQLETSLLVCPALSANFDKYLDCLEWGQQLLVDAGWEGEVQLASFHPQYCFEGVAEQDRSNFTNRAPQAIFHILREASLEAAINHYGDTSAIPERNINQLRGMGVAKFERLFSFLDKN